MFTLRTKPCSFNNSMWIQEKAAINCHSSVKVYHCIPDNLNRLGEICTQPVWVKPNYCPDYNIEANELNVIPCNSSTGCPDVLFLSNQVYRYPVCFNKTIIDDGKDLEDNIALPPWTLVLIGVASLFLLIVAVLCFRRCVCRKKKDEESYHLLLGILENEQKFHKTAAFHEGVNFIVGGGKLLCLVGQWGSGKTSTAKQVCFEVSNTQPIIIRNILQFEDGRQPVILDEAINKGISEVEMENFRKKIQQFYENMSHLPTKAFIILTLGENMEAFFDYIQTLVSSESEIKIIDLSKRLTNGDRTQILSLQFRTHCPGKNFSKVEKLALKGNDKSLGYPEICALFSMCPGFQNVVPLEFCNRPLHHLKRYLEIMHNSKDNKKFLMLVYISLNEMMIDLNVSNDMLHDLLLITKRNSNTQTVGPNNPPGAEIQECTDIEMHGAEPIKYEMSKEFLDLLIPKEFVVQEEKETIYRLQHYVIKRMTLIVFGTYHFEKLLHFSKREDLRGWIEESGLFFSNPLIDTKPILKIKGDQWKQYQKWLNKVD